MEDMLTQQYVWTIQNESFWYRRAQVSVDQNNAAQFWRVSYSAITRVERDRNETLTSETKKWVVRELMRQLLQDTKPKDVPSSFRQHVGLPAQQAKVVDFLDSITVTIDEWTNLKTATLITEEQKIMNTTAFATKHFVYGQDTTNMTEEQLIEAIKKIEAEIANLGAVKTKSKKIAERTAELETMLAAVVTVLDAK